MCVRVWPRVAGLSGLCGARRDSRLLPRGLPRGRGPITNYQAKKTEPSGIRPPGTKRNSKSTLASDRSVIGQEPGAGTTDQEPLRNSTAAAIAPADTLLTPPCPVAEQVRALPLARRAVSLPMVRPAACAAAPIRRRVRTAQRRPRGPEAQRSGRRAARRSPDWRQMRRAQRRVAARGRGLRPSGWTSRRPAGPGVGQPGVDRLGLACAERHGRDGGECGRGAGGGAQGDGGGGAGGGRQDGEPPRPEPAHPGPRSQRAEHGGQPRHRAKGAARCGSPPTELACEHLPKVAHPIHGRLQHENKREAAVQRAPAEQPQEDERVHPFKHERPAPRRGQSLWEPEIDEARYEQAEARGGGVGEANVDGRKPTPQQRR
eukprot:scaffold6575_cov120-Isochrysis_galbana.AAC.2